MLLPKRLVYFFIVFPAIALPCVDSECPCAEPTHCELVKTSPQKELFVFRAGFTDDWKRYDWSNITTVAAFGQYNPELMCYAHSRGVRFILTADYPASALSNATARSAWVKLQVNTALLRHMDGINFDFEAILSQSEAPYLIALVNETSRAFREANPYAQISFDTPYAPWSRRYNFKALAELCDFLVLMNYDISDPKIAIPNDPIQDFKRGVQSFLHVGVPANKLVTAFPWYGYDYDCASISKEICYKTGKQAHIQRRSKLCYDNVTQLMRKFPKNGTLNAKYQSKFFDYKSAATGNYRQVWYDDPETLLVRYLYARDTDLRGVSMWNADCLDYSDDPEAEKLTKAMWHAIGQFMPPVN